MKEQSLSEEIRFGSHHGFDKEFILTKDIKQAIQRLKDEIWGYGGDVKRSWLIREIDKIFGDKLVEAKDDE